MLHCALYQKGVSLENDIRRLLEQEEVTLHTFISAPQLFVNPRRYDLDLLIFAPRRDLSEPLRILKHIQQDVVLSLPPAVFLLHHPSERVLLRCFEAGVDEVCDLSAS